jgi:hypothetical protein
MYLCNINYKQDVWRLWASQIIWNKFLHLARKFNSRNFIIVHTYLSGLWVWLKTFALTSNSLSFPIVSERKCCAHNHTDTWIYGPKEPHSEFPNHTNWHFGRYKARRVAHPNNPIIRITHILIPIYIHIIISIQIIKTKHISSTRSILSTVGSLWNIPNCH